MPRIPDYELLRRIGEGGYGEVWLARGLTGLYCAVKIVRRDRFSADEPFEREFRGLTETMTGRAGAPGGLALLHVGQNEAERYFYYVMELADDAERGRAVDPASYVPLTLRELRQRRGRLPADECVRLCLPAARELAALHARGLVHRDIKPSNLIVVDGLAKLADIGLVSRAAAALTFVGTEGYVPPEGPGSPAADVWALGKVLYELGTGQERDEFPKLPAALGDAREQARLFALNRVWLRACDPAAKNRFANGGELLAALEALAAGGTPRRRRTVAAGLAAGALAAALALGGYHLLHRKAEGPRAVKPPDIPPAILPAISSKSLAVLPFENKSEDKANDYLADGIQDDVLTSLAGISGLKVVAQASAMRYRGSTASSRQIGAELGVAYILNGSLRREGNLIRLTARLVDTRSDQQVWARNFDREVSGILALQSELAAEITPALQVALNPSERAALARGPTRDLSAYDLYLQARKLRREANGELGPQEKAEALLREAVARDANFVRAWTELATVRLDIYADHNERHRPAQAALVQEAVEAAQRLAPNAPEVLLVMGRLQYACLGDDGAAMFYYQKILADYPSYPDVHEALALLYRKEGRWADLVRELRTAWRLEPGNRQLAGALKWALRWMHAYAEADAVLGEQLKLWPDDRELHADSIMPPFRNTGSRAGFESWFASLTPAERESPENVRNRIFWASLTGDKPMLFDLVKRHGAGLDDIDALVAVIRSGPAGLGLSVLERLKPEIDRELAADPLDFNAWVSLAKYHALRGNEKEAMNALDRVRQLVPEGSHALNVAAAYKDVAMVLGWLGRKDEAVALVEKLVSRPGFVHVWNLKYNVAWAPLRNDPRVQAIIADPRNVAPLFAGDGSAAAPEAETPAPAAASGPAVAVLPLDNLSPAPDDAGFAAGVHEDVLNHLANLAGLRVISRTSVLQYRGTTKTIRQIARELGVAYVLEGSVQRAGDRVRVTAQLINAATDEPCWSKSYDRVLQDIFAVQSDLARRIAVALDATLSPAEAAGLETPPTKNLEAYECYQKALVLGRSEANATEVRDRIVPLLERAVALDPDYVAAWVELSLNQLELVATDNAGGRLTQAKTALARAEQLAPDSLAVLAAGAQLGALTGDRDAVNRRRRRLIELYPNRPEAHVMRALTAAYEGRWADELAGYRAALGLEPRNPDILLQYIFILDGMRRWDEAETVAATLLEVQPDNLNARLQEAGMVFRRSGSTAKFTRLLASLPRSKESDKDAIIVRSRLAFFAGDWAGMAALWREAGPRFKLGVVSDLEARFMVAGALLKLGDPASARPLLEQSREELRHRVAADPGNVTRWNELGLTLGMLGDRSDARAALDHAAELIAADPRGPQVLFRSRFDNTIARAWIDDKRDVIRKIGPMLREPVPHPPAACVRVLRIYWASIPLQGDPEFEAMLDDPKNNEPLF